MRAWILIVVSLAAGCDISLDPDSLVRHLRVLGGRVGEATPESVSQLSCAVAIRPGPMLDLACERDQLELSALLASPHGKGRRLEQEPSPVIDWYLCTSPRSFVLPGSIDPACARFGPGDPDPRSGMNPSLTYLGSGARLKIEVAALVAGLRRHFQDALASAGGMGPGRATLPMGPSLIQLPLVLRAANFSGASDSLDTETAFLFLRLAYALPGAQPPPPNRNPVLGEVTISESEAGEQAKVLMPCPESGPCPAFPVRRDGAYYLTPALPAPERYVPMDESGRGEIEEVLRVSWFSTDGEFSAQRTGSRRPQTKWENKEPHRAPPEVTAVDVWIVLQDDRGGSAWQRYALSFID